MSRKYLADLGTLPEFPFQATLAGVPVSYKRLDVPVTVTGRVNLEPGLYWIVQGGYRTTASDSRLYIEQE